MDVVAIDVHVHPLSEEGLNLFAGERRAALSRYFGADLQPIPIAHLADDYRARSMMAVLLGHFPDSLHGRAVGLFFAIGGVGWTVIPILIGAYARRTSLQRGFTVAVGAALGLSGVAAALFLR